MKTMPCATAQCDGRDLGACARVDIKLLLTHGAQCIALRLRAHKQRVVVGGDAPHLARHARLLIELRVAAARAAVKVHFVLAALVGEEAVREWRTGVAGGVRRLDLVDRGRIKRHPRVVGRGAPLPYARDLWGAEQALARIVD